MGTIVRRRTVGAVRLRNELFPRISQAQLAEKLNVTQQAVSAWLHGRARPDLAKMLKIEALLGIPIASWADEIPRPDEEEEDDGGDDDEAA
jgi:transcriptional regulator with XRE-family HTH domain